MSFSLNSSAMQLINVKANIDRFDMGFYSNTNSSNDGGALNILNSTITFDGNSFFNSNKTSGLGGAIFIKSSSLTFRGSASFMDNSASM